MTIHEEEKPSFKVVDKRGMIEEEDEGGCCGGHHHHDDEDDMSAADADGAHGDHRPRPEMSFSLFVQTLAHQTMMGLGIVPWPDSGLVKVELGLAKETIDIIVMLKEKTKNNLDSEEQLMLDSLLYQLQMAFMDISKTNPSPIIK